tara:strand:+ start:450 stop:680 length:231 start_codon:yes stop_codon:yes gene_type:complete
VALSEEEIGHSNRLRFGFVKVGREVGIGDHQLEVGRPGIRVGLGSVDEQIEELVLPPCANGSNLDRMVSRVLLVVE